VEYLSQRAGCSCRVGGRIHLSTPHLPGVPGACYLTDHDYPDGWPSWHEETGPLAGSGAAGRAKAARGSAFAVWALVEALCYREPGAAESTPDDAWGALLAGQALVETAGLERISERDQTKVDRVRRWLCASCRVGSCRRGAGGSRAGAGQAGDRA